MISRVRICSTAEQVGLVSVVLSHRGGLEGALDSNDGTVIVVDLGDARVEPFDLLEDIGNAKLVREIVTIGFFSHVMIEQKQRAKALGCDLILPRSEFFKRLPDLLVEKASGLER